MREDHPLATRPMLRLRAVSIIGSPLPDNSLPEMPVACVPHGDAITFQVQTGIGGMATSHGLAVHPLMDDDKAHAPPVVLHLKDRFLPVAARKVAAAIDREPVTAH